MKFNLKTSFALITIFLIGMLLGNVLKPHTYMTPSNEACDVYEFIISKDSNRSFENPTYNRLVTVGTDKRNFPNVAPEIFENSTDVHFIDTSDFFDNLQSNQEYNLKGCEFSNDISSTLHHGSFEVLVLKANFVKFRDNIRPIVREFSAVAFSDNNQYAIVYVSNNCGGWCGYGGTYLLEKIDGQWAEIGYAWMWAA